MALTSKTTTSNLFNRYVWLANLIHSCGPISFDEIARRWKSSFWNDDHSDLALRTFHAHKDAVEELFGVSIKCNRHIGFKYYIENDDDIESGSLRNWLLNSMEVSNMLTESQGLRDRILLEDIPSGLSWLSTVVGAIRDGLKLEITYRKYTEAEGKTSIVEPYCVKLFRQRWYLVGHHADGDYFRTYSLDRIVSCTTTGDSFKMKDDFDAKEFFNDYFGVFVMPEVKLERVRLRVEGVTASYTRSLPLHHSQKEIETGEGYSIFEYAIRPTKDFITELVHMSPSAKVLEPQWLADEVKEQIAAMHG